MSRTASACWTTASIARTLRNELPTTRTLPRAFQSRPAPSRCLHSTARQQLPSPLRATAQKPQHQHLRARHFSTTASQRKYKTVQQAESRYRSGPFSWAAGALFLLSGAGLIVYFQYEKARMERKRIAEATKGIGKPKVGGSFNLVDQDGKPFADEKLRGKYALVSRSRSPPGKDGVEAEDIGDKPLGLNGLRGAFESKR